MFLIVFLFCVVVAENVEKFTAPSSVPSIVEAPFISPRESSKPNKKPHHNHSKPPHYAQKKKSEVPTTINLPSIISTTQPTILNSKDNENHSKSKAIMPNSLPTDIPDKNALIIPQVSSNKTSIVPSLDPSSNDISTNTTEPTSVSYTSIPLIKTITKSIPSLSPQHVFNQSKTISITPIVDTNISKYFSNTTLIPSLQTTSTINKNQSNIPTPTPVPIIEPLEILDESEQPISDFISPSPSPSLTITSISPQVQSIPTGLPYFVPKISPVKTLKPTKEHHNHKKPPHYLKLTKIPISDNIPTSTTITSNPTLGNVNSVPISKNNDPTFKPTKGRRKKMKPSISPAVSNLGAGTESGANNNNNNGQNQNTNEGGTTNTNEQNKVISETNDNTDDLTTNSSTTMFSSATMMASITLIVFILFMFAYLWW